MPPGTTSSRNLPPPNWPEILKERFGDAVIDSYTDSGCLFVRIRREAILQVCGLLKKDHAFEMLADLTCIDWLDRAPRFEVLYNLYSVTNRHRLFLKVPLTFEDPTVDSMTPLWGIADWFEREVWDMYGIRFAGHPDLRRILMYEEFQGHPLRKDYAINERQPLVPPILNPGDRIPV